MKIDKNYRTDELFTRWMSILRMKASEYEHKARGKGKIVSSPNLDDVVNEMMAYLAGQLK